MMAWEIPWLPIDPDDYPVIQTLIFNLQVPPFNNVKARQAFSYAIDREAALAAANPYLGNFRYASTFTPAQTLGRDLYGEVGISYDPARALELLQEAGVSAPSSFPSVTLIVPAYGTTYPYARTLIANKLAEMWQTNLGITVKVLSLTMPEMKAAREAGGVAIIFQGWVNDKNDPDSFMRDLLRSDSSNNLGHYYNTAYDALVDQAFSRKDPGERQALYIEAERLLCETDAAVYPLYVPLP
jgi:oligopeptide transport system substrate-binding protein